MSSLIDTLIDQCTPSGGEFDKMRFAKLIAKLCAREVVVRPLGHDLSGAEFALDAADLRIISDRQDASMKISQLFGIAGPSALSSAEPVAIIDQSTTDKG